MSYIVINHAPWREKNTEDTDDDTAHQENKPNHDLIQGSVLKDFNTDDPLVFKSMMILFVEFPGLTKDSCWDTVLVEGFDDVWTVRIDDGRKLRQQGP